MGVSRMFWRRRERRRADTEPTSPTVHHRADTEERPEERFDDLPEGDGDSEATRTSPGPIELERDALRPVAIQRAAEELSRRGDRVVELFKEVSSPRGRANLAIHLLRGSEQESVFVEVATGPWDGEAIKNAARTASILRGSDHADAGLEFLSAYPLPDEVRFFQERSAAALLGLDLMQGDNLAEPEACAEAFRDAANHHWGLGLNYEADNLPLIEELSTTALNESSGDTKSPILDSLVHGLGCYVGEILRCHASQEGAWRQAEEWGEGIVLELSDLTADPVGQARAFLKNGPEDSVAFYANYVLEELGDKPR